MRSIVMHGDACPDILHLESLYYCVKELSDTTMVLFNGANYVIVCLSQSKHVVIVSLRAKKIDGARSILWARRVAESIRGDDHQ